MTRGTLRLSAGALKGRQVTVPPGVRPTGSRVREALFDILGPRVEGRRFLDLFAGSGAVGLEAVSRGAAACIQVDSSSRVVDELRRRYRDLATASARAVRLELPRGLTKLAAMEVGRFDVIFADPPYVFEDFEPLLAGLAPLAHADSIAVLEHDRRTPVPAEEGDWTLERSRRYGESELSFYAVS